MTFMKPETREKLKHSMKTYTLGFGREHEEPEGFRKYARQTEIIDICQFYKLHVDEWLNYINLFGTEWATYFSTFGQASVKSHI